MNKDIEMMKSNVCAGCDYAKDIGHFVCGACYFTGAKPLRTYREDVNGCTVENWAKITKKMITKR